MVRALLILLLLAACDSPAPQMAGGRAVPISRGGRDYVVHLKGNRVEVIRLGWAAAADRAAIRAQMAALIPEVAGCAADPGSLTGDSGEIRARLACARAGP